MGIQGLIPFLSKASKRVNISQFSGQCVAIDAYCWLHKGAYACVDKLAKGIPCDEYVHYCMKFINLLLSHKIKPILVFDGRHLPAKADTEAKRRVSRQESRKRAADLLRAGRTDEARNYLKRCIDVTHEMALALMEQCHKKNVDCIVAPYEADAQLAYLCLKGIAQVVITEDSDLVLFGCSKILFKFDLTGNGLLVEQEQLYLAMKVRPENFSFEKFRYMCILSGCDYLPSLPGIGLAKALKFVTKISDPDIHRALTRLPSQLNMTQLTVTEQYRDDFVRAEAAFKHQLVFDPFLRKIVPLSETESDVDLGNFAGEMLNPDVAYQLALGNLDPFTLKKVANFNPDSKQEVKVWQQTGISPHCSIWSPDYKIHSNKAVSKPCQALHPVEKAKTVVINISMNQMKRKFVEDNTENELTNKQLASMYSITPTFQEVLPSEDILIENKSVLEIEEQDVTFTNLESSFCKKVTAESNSYEKECHAEITTPRKDEPKNEITSPILRKYERVNPFNKEIKSVSCETKNIGALFKFESHQQTVVHKKIVSRYFLQSSNSNSDTVIDETKNISNNLDTMCSLPEENEISSTKIVSESSKVEFQQNVEQSNSEDCKKSGNKSSIAVFEWDSKRIDCSSVPVTNISLNVSQQFKNPFKKLKKSENDSVDEFCSSGDSGIQSIGDIEECEVPVTVISENLPKKATSPPAQARKSGNCRRPGLGKKSPSVTSGQQSLLSRFGFHKREKL